MATLMMAVIGANHPWQWPAHVWIAACSSYLCSGWS